MENHYSVEAKPGISDDFLLELLRSMPEVKRVRILTPGFISVALVEEVDFSAKSRDKLNRYARIRKKSLRQPSKRRF
jgi:hypothetical protein